MPAEKHIQFWRADVAGNLPDELLEGEFAVDYLDMPRHLYVGTNGGADYIDLLRGSVMTDATPPVTGNFVGRMWWDGVHAQLYIWEGEHWVVAVNQPIPPPPDLSHLLPKTGGTITSLTAAALTINGPNTTDQLLTVNGRALVSDRITSPRFNIDAGYFLMRHPGGYPEIRWGASAASASTLWRDIIVNNTRKIQYDSGGSFSAAEDKLVIDSSGAVTVDGWINFPLSHRLGVIIGSYQWLGLGSQTAWGTQGIWFSASANTVQVSSPLTLTAMTSAAAPVWINADGWTLLARTSTNQNQFSVGRQAGAVTDGVCAYIRSDDTGQYIGGRFRVQHEIVGGPLAGPADPGGTRVFAIDTGWPSSGDINSLRAEFNVPVTINVAAGVGLTINRTDAGQALQINCTTAGVYQAFNVAVPGVPQALNVNSDGRVGIAHSLNLGGTLNLTMGGANLQFAGVSATNWWIIAPSFDFRNASASFSVPLTLGSTLIFTGSPTAPIPGPDGYLWYDTTAGELKFRQGGVWRTIQMV